MNFNITPVVRNLLLINVGIMLIQTLYPVLDHILGLHYLKSHYFLPFQFVTYMFAHGNFSHLLSNMLGLFFFGPLLEQVWGSKRFLFFYMFTGIGAGLIYTGIHYYEVSQIESAMSAFIQDPNPDALASFFRNYASNLYDSNLNFINTYAANPSDQNLIKNSVSFVKEIYRMNADTPMVGASGAIFGILIAFAMLFPNTEMMLLFFPFPIKAKYFVAMYGAYELWAGVHQSPGDNVAHFAHLGGMLFGFILVQYWKKNRKIFY